MSTPQFSIFQNYEYRRKGLKCGNKECGAPKLAAGAKGSCGFGESRFYCDQCDPKPFEIGASSITGKDPCGDKVQPNQPPPGFCKAPQNDQDGRDGDPTWIRGNGGRICSGILNVEDITDAEQLKLLETRFLPEGTFEKPIGNYTNCSKSNLSQNYRDSCNSFNEVLAQYCALDTDKGCPRDPNGYEVKTCSRMVSSDPDYYICQNIANRYDTLSEVTKANFCTNYPDSYNCKCFNRSSNPDYQSLVNYYIANDKCWWLYCKDPNTNLIPNDIHESTQCPETVCQQSITITNPQEKSIVENNKMILDCSRSETNQSSTPSDENKKSSSLLLWILIPVVAIVLIGIILTVIFILKKKQNKTINKK